ncbi:hypothetical protein [Veillonella criceti]|uniref:Uncharacterized protein n=1 Tax=Veillonella criceti TaxID=103891 RepID=A0A380NKH6_9FIRM|nr:hypothetical protein [Veillonella criceti]SUP42442.1 Uncharacterised protein [Veillonella criceti]
MPPNKKEPRIARPLTVVDVWRIVGQLEVIAFMFGLVFIETEGKRLLFLALVHTYLQLTIFYQIRKKENYLE